MGKTNNNKTTIGSITLTEAGEELSDLLVELYKSKTFIRFGKDLFDMALKNGFEGGALVASIPNLTERQIKIATANSAILKLSQMIYVLDGMVKAEMYTDEQIMKVKLYASDIINALKEMLANVSLPQKKITVKSPISVSSVDGQAIAAGTYTEVPNGDDDGFDDIVTSPYIPTDYDYDQSVVAESK
jgi:hypothetical protein